jgi:hypothetical protein
MGRSGGKIFKVKPETFYSDGIRKLVERSTKCTIILSNFSVRSALIVLLSLSGFQRHSAPYISEPRVRSVNDNRTPQLTRPGQEKRDASAHDYDEEEEEDSDEGGCRQ